MTIYIYTEGNTTIETININEIPEGVSYETIEREEDGENLKIKWKIRFFFYFFSYNIVSL